MPLPHSSLRNKKSMSAQETQKLEKVHLFAYERLHNKSKKVIKLEKSLFCNCQSDNCLQQGWQIDVKTVVWKFIKEKEIYGEITRRFLIS